MNKTRSNLSSHLDDSPKKAFLTSTLFIDCSRFSSVADVIQACTRPSLPRPPVEDPTSPPHNYEYVVYPALTNSLPPPYSNSAHNSMGMW